MDTIKTSTRYRVRDDYETATPVHVVWEITLACNLKCSHCGSRAGKVRPGELTTEQCFDVIDSLKRLGTREISIIGGEAFLRKDWIEIIERIHQSGIECSMQSGAYNLNEERIISAKKAGINNIGVSIDGMPDTHNKIRGRRDSFEHAVNCLALLKKHNITSSVNTVITKRSKNEMNELLDVLIENNVKNWQIQLAVAMGNAVDHSDELIVQPYELIDFYDDLIVIYRKALAHNILIQAGNNIGYFGPYEHIWRQGNEKYYTGCSAGHTGIGIEADGKIKGCPSLPTSAYTGGNVKDMALEDIWKYSEEMVFSRYRNKEELWGGCKGCYYESSCLAGCTWTSHVLFGKRGNNPFCHHRALELKKKGLKERIRKIQEAPGESFDMGLFEIIVEDENGVIVEIQSPTSEAPIQVTGPIARVPRIPKALKLCNGCDNYVYEEEEVCSFCNSEVKKVNEEYAAKMEAAKRSLEKLEFLMMK
ncbi:radical SAM/SPASM domain-containing protein [Flavobacterium collinsii]|jgi:radical SAM protein with 4Fe4S-binding SPASM domain|uniref:PqqA peptide cyclase n=1 Tax=Flavobacterium collinsii TaxID=1114861 RepID=A0ABM8KLJ3_9FLAO|nr:radical SAM protein [Flavobacterium collinsii]GIQ58691.1 GDL motif peptide-associated radical SAM/SPASM maturase [Flavobacterium collinsii]CAA9200513.1 PqqA peptide cyclase [Flavobacterium collinsii]